MRPALIFGLLLIFSGCRHQPGDHSTLKVDTTQGRQNDPLHSRFSQPPSPPDSLPRFTVDDFPVPDSLLNVKPIRARNVESVDLVWLCDSSRSSFLVLAMYTDHFRERIYRFNALPGSGTKLQELPIGFPGTSYFVDTSRQRATTGTIRGALAGFLRQARIVDKSCFSSIKGLYPGVSRSAALSGYSPADSVTKHKDIAQYCWSFQGENYYNPETYRKGTPIARNSFGHRIQMHFRNDVLIAFSLGNDIP